MSSRCSRSTTCSTPSRRAGSLRGARSLLRALEAHLGVRAGETTPDGRITLGHEECLGSCGTAPAMRVDGSYCENVDQEEAKRIVDALE
jgi:NADH-quinone oxidoreductase subunit E